MKGLKTLSEIAKQQPEYLDVCAAATISRLLGQQVKSLRSQVARAACLAAGDVFSSQIRGIDQVIHRKDYHKVENCCANTFYIRSNLALLSLRP